MRLKTRLSSKGQIVLPKEIRERSGWRTGSEVSVEEVAGGVLLKLAAGPQDVSIDDLLGCVRYRGPRRSLKQMDAAIQALAKRRK